MRRIWINTLHLFLLLLLAGCATTQEELLTHDKATMLELWNRHSGGAVNRTLLDARQALRRPLTERHARDTPAINRAYTRSAQNEIQSQFPRLPNPDLVMYVFPHVAGSDPVPVPGYSTVFPFYRQVQYALPGERTEDL